MKLTDICEDIFLINLDRRVDRLTDFIKQSERLDFTFTKISAIDGNTIENKNTLRNGEIGLLKTYAALINFAKHEKLPSILVCEDDVEFNPDIEERLEKEWKEVPQDADLVFLGCNRESLGAGQIPAERVTDNILRVKSVYGMHCHWIKETIYDEVLFLIERFDRPLDVLYGDIQQKYYSYGFCRNLCHQLDSFSDIILTTPNYNKLGIFN